MFEFKILIFVHREINLDLQIGLKIEKETVPSFEHFKSWYEVTPY